MTDILKCHIDFESKIFVRQVHTKCPKNHFNEVFVTPLLVLKTIVLGGLNRPVNWFSKYVLMEYLENGLDIGWHSMYDMGVWDIHMWDPLWFKWFKMLSLTF